MYQSKVKGHEMALLLELSLLGKRLWQGQINSEAMCTTGAYQLPLDLFLYIYNQHGRKLKVDCHGTKKQKQIYSMSAHLAAVSTNIYLQTHTWTHKLKVGPVQSSGPSYRTTFQANNLCSKLGVQQ